MPPPPLWVVAMVDIHSTLCEYRPTCNLPTILGQPERGEADLGKMVVGGIIILITLPALIGVAINIQSSFAALPAFNGIWATIIALLLVGGVTLRMLGYE